MFKDASIPPTPKPYGMESANSSQNERETENPKKPIAVSVMLMVVTSQVLNFFVSRSLSSPARTLKMEIVVDITPIYDTGTPN